jgi:hypothetical protein
MRSWSSNRSGAWAAAGCALAAALVLTLSACGGGSGEATAGGVSAGTVPEQTVQLSPATGKKRTAAGSACDKQVGEFLGAMDTLRTNLVAGLSYEQYVAEVELIRGAYNRVPVDRLALACLQGAGTPGEAGLNKYIAASNAWTGCVETPGCESAGVEPALQSRWRQASKLLGEAEAGLKALEKHPNAP